MNNLIVETANGHIDFITDTEVRLVQITGVSGIGQVNTQSTAGRNGSTKVSHNTPERRPVIEFRIRGCADAEKVQYDIPRIFENGMPATITMHSRTCSTRLDCFCETAIIDPNQAPPMRGFLTFVCTDPFFHALIDSFETIAGSESFFSFPFIFPSEPFYISKRQESVFKEIINDGVSDTPMKIVFKASAKVINPYLENVDTGEMMQLKFTMERGDIITITTGKDDKRIILTRDGEETDIINFKKFPFYFFSLKAGKNLFKFGADSGVDSLDITAQYSPQFPSMYGNIKGGTDRIGDTEIVRRLQEIGYIIKRGGLGG